MKFCHFLLSFKLAFGHPSINHIISALCCNLQLTSPANPQFPAFTININTDLFAPYHSWLQLPADYFSNQHPMKQWIWLLTSWTRNYKDILPKLSLFLTDATEHYFLAACLVQVTTIVSMGMMGQVTCFWWHKKLQVPESWAKHAGETQQVRQHTWRERIDDVLSWDHPSYWWGLGWKITVKARWGWSNA